MEYPQPVSALEQKRIMRDLQDSKIKAVKECDVERHNQNRDLVVAPLIDWDNADPYDYE